MDAFYLDVKYQYVGINNKMRRLAPLFLKTTKSKSKQARTQTSINFLLCRIILVYVYGIFVFRNNMSENFGTSTDKHNKLEDPVHIQEPSPWQQRPEHPILSKEEFMQQIQQQNQAMNFEIFLMKSIPMCFKKCVAKPGTSLDKYEQTCVNRCAELYADTWRLVGQSFHHRMHNLANTIETSK